MVEVEEALLRAYTLGLNSNRVPKCTQSRLSAHFPIFRWGWGRSRPTGGPVTHAYSLVRSQAYPLPCSSQSPLLAEGVTTIDAWCRWGRGRNGNQRVQVGFRTSARPRAAGWRASLMVVPAGRCRRALAFRMRMPPTWRLPFAKTTRAHQLARRVGTTRARCSASKLCKCRGAACLNAVVCFSERGRTLLSTGDRRI